MKWTPIKGYEAIYFINKSGDVSTFRIRNGRGLLKKRRLLVPAIDTEGYYSVSLFINSKKRTYRIHRLMTETFISNLQNKKCVNHRDGNKLNNKLSNLEWATHSENTQHAHNIGLIPLKLGRTKYMKGIIWDNHNNRFVTKLIGIDGRLHKKYFKTLKEALEYKQQFLLKLSQ